MKRSLTLLAAFLVSCSSDYGPWLLGDWFFDEEYTAKKHAEKPPENDLAGATTAMVKGQLFEQMKGAKLNFTPKEFTMTTKDGNGKSFAYTVMENTAADAVTLKMEDGELTTFRREGDRLWMNSTGNVKEPFYFKRK